ncbi:MAG: BspA family leucine-rich repeat surface protein [Oscillospiraceae bacterium]|nr:BspA family leucine-rich repeat surface protein [Oscillospiraceae bacterium]
MNKKMIAVLTSFLMLASMAAPAYADVADTTEPVSVVQDSETKSDIDEPVDSATDIDVSVTDEPADSVTDNDIDTPVTDEPADEPAVDDKQDEPVADEPADEPAVDDKQDEPVIDEPADEPAVDDTQDEPVTDEPADEPADEDEQDDAADSSEATEDSTGTEDDTEEAETDDGLLDEEEEFNADTDWMNISGTTLTIKGTIPSTVSNAGGLRLYWSGLVDVSKITKVVTVSGAKAPANCYQLFDSFTGLQSADLSNMDVSTVTNMQWMFYGCGNLTTVNLTNWKKQTSKVTNMRGMFSGCSKLTTVTDMYLVWAPNVTTMENMFSGCTSLTSIDTPYCADAKAVNMTSTFYNCSKLTSVFLYMNLNTSSTWTSAFDGCTSLRRIYSWKGPVTIPESAKLVNSKDSGWYKYVDSDYVLMSGEGDIANFIMLEDTNYYRRSWYTWDSAAGKLTIQGRIPSHGTNSIPDITGISAESIKTVTTAAGAHTGTSAGDLFYKCSNLTSADLSKLNVASCTNFIRTFCRCSNLTSLTMPTGSTNTVTYIDYMFRFCSKLESIDLTKFNFSTSLSSGGAFEGCSSLATLKLPANFKMVTGMKLSNYSSDYGYFGWKATTNASSVSGTGEFAAFSVGSANTYNRVLNWFKWDDSSGTLTIQGAVPSGNSDNIAVRTKIGAITSSSVKKVTSVSGASFPAVGTARLFQNMSAMTSADLSKVNTSNSTSFFRLFDGCSSLTSVNLSGLSTSKITDLQYMFNGCSKLTKIDISSFDISNVKFGNSSYISGMFSGCSALATLGLPNGFIVKTEMNLPNVGGSYSGWAKQGTTTVVSGTGTYAEFNVSGKTTSVRVTSSAPTSVTLNKSTMTLAVGTSEKLTATVNPSNANDKTVAWGTNASSIATVSTDGTVTAKAVGTATITVVTSNGKSATCVVTVTATAPKPAKPSVVIKTAFGGRTVQLNCADTDAEIYYNFGSSNITTSCNHVKAGESIFLNEPMTGNKAAMYFKAYKSGKWSDLGKWGVLNVQIAKPIIVVSGKVEDNNFRVYTQTKDSYIVYTLDGSDPSIKEGSSELKVTNGRLVWGTSTIVNIPKGRTIKAIAIRNGLVTSEVMEYKNEG